MAPLQSDASAASALNHPNILSIYDVGTHDGSPYVVSELLEGQTLRQRTSGTALPQRKTIDYALQVVCLNNKELKNIVDGVCRPNYSLLAYNCSPLLDR